MRGADVAGEVIDTAYVRIRPSTAGFSQEASQQVNRAVAGVQTTVTRAGRATRDATSDFDHFNRGLLLTEARALGLKSVLGGVSTLFIGGAGVATLFHVATEEFSNFTTVAATTNAILEATGSAAHVTAAGVAALATELEHKTGIDDEQIKSAENVLLTFRAVRNEVGTGNDVFNRATRSAADLSKVFGQDVASTARQLGRALQDPERGLLTLRRAGLTFSASQTAVIKNLVQTGQLLKAQTLILAEVDRRVGGTAESVGRTLPGQLNILRERAKDALGEYVRRLSESRDASAAAAAGGSALAAGFDVVKRSVETLGPPLVTVVKAAAAVERVTGAGPLLAAAVAYKAVGVAVGLAGRVQVAYAKATAIAAGANAAEAASAVAVTASARAEITSLAGASFALRGYSTGAFAATEANTALAASNVAVATSGRAAAIGAGASRLALAAVGGPLGAVTIGVAALAAGFILLRRHASEAAGTLKGAQRALDDFNASAAKTQEIRVRVTGAQQAIRDARAIALAAQAGLAAATSRQASSSAAPGSLEQRALADQVRTARANLTKATNNLERAETNLATAQTDQFQHQERQPTVIQAATQRILDQVDALRQQARLAAAGNFRVGGFTANQPTLERATRTLRAFQSLMEKLSQSGTRADRVVGQALGRISAQVGRLPTKKEIAIVLRFSTSGKTIDEIVKEAGVGVGVRDETQLLEQAKERAAAVAAASTAENVALQQQFAAAQKILKTQKETLKTRREDAAAARDALTSAQDAVTNAIDSLTSANESLAASQRALADSIKQGQAAVTSAVRDAKSNLRSIASSIADAISQAADQGALKLGPQGPLAAKFKQLRDQILAGRGGPDTQRAAQEVAARLQAQQPTDDAAARAKRALDDLTDSFTRGRIKPAQFSQGIQGILRDAGLNFRTFGKTFGQAALNNLKDNIAAAKAQAQALAAGPSRPGSGAEPNIVRPLEAVAQAQRDTRDATRSVERAQRDVGRAQRELQKQELSVAKAQAADLKAIRGVVTQQLKVQKTQSTLTDPKKKPTGTAGKDANATTASGANAP